MTTLLEATFEKISALSEIEQNIYAKNLLEEIASEKNGTVLSLNLKICCLRWQMVLGRFEKWRDKDSNTRSTLISHTNSNFWKLYQIQIK